MPELDVAPSEVPPAEIDLRTPLERAQAGELLNAQDLAAIFKLRKSRFHELLKAGAFEEFKTKPAISNYCYSGVKVWRHLSGDPVYEPTFGRKRR
jgi:hypothetical protein